MKIGKFVFKVFGVIDDKLNKKYIFCSVFENDIHECNVLLNDDLGNLWVHIMRSIKLNHDFRADYHREKQINNFVKKIKQFREYIHDNY